eukprot:UN07877
MTCRLSNFISITNENATEIIKTQKVENRNLKGFKRLEDPRSLKKGAGVNYWYSEQSTSKFAAY